MTDLKTYTFWLPHLTNNEERAYGQCTVEQSMESDEGCIKNKDDSKDGAYIVKNLQLSDGTNNFHIDYLDQEMLKTREIYESFLSCLTTGDIGDWDEISEVYQRSRWMFDSVTGDEGLRSCKIVLIDSSTRFKKLYCNVSVPELDITQNGHGLSHLEMNSKIIRDTTSELLKAKQLVKGLQKNEAIRENLYADLDLKREERDSQTLSFFLEILNSKKQTIWNHERKLQYYQDLLDTNNIQFDRMTETEAKTETETDEEDEDDAKFEKIDISESDTDQELDMLDETMKQEIEREDSRDAHINMFVNSNDNSSQSQRVKYNKSNPFVF